MQISAQAQAVLLLTAHFSKTGKDGAKPLANREWARFAVWLRDHRLEPSSLLNGDLSLLLEGWSDERINQPRIDALLARSAALGLALERWQRSGLWILTRSDADYPKRLKARLKEQSPPVLFGCGARRLLNGGGVAVVGGRNAAENDLAFAAAVGKRAANRGSTVVSGGARGVDETAMLAALEDEGTVVGVLADSLLQKATSQKYRKHLMAEDLVLVSPFNPEAGFNAGNAMARNRYIYCLADSAVVVSSGKGRGGTWSGAVETLKAGWVPVWVQRSTNASSGNADIVQLGAQWLPEGDLVPPPPVVAQESDSVSTGVSEPEVFAEEAITDEVAARDNTPTVEVFADSEQQPSPLPPRSDPTAQLPKRVEPKQTPTTVQTLDEIGFYDLFLHQMARQTANAPLSVDEVAERFDVAKGQVAIWLKRAVAAGVVRKLAKPVRYQWDMESPKQTGMFSED